jgi:hypothetical protein
VNFEVVGCVSSSEVEDSLETSRNEPIGQSGHPKEQGMEPRREIKQSFKVKSNI